MECSTKSTGPPNTSIERLNTFSKSSTLVASAGITSQFSFSERADTSPIRTATGVFDKVMVAASSPLASRKSLSDEEITSKPLVTTNTALRNVLAKRFGNHAISLSSTDFSLRKRMVESGAAHSFLPAFAPLTIDSNGKFALCDMQCPYELEIGFIGTKEGFESEAFLELVRILDGFYEKHLDTRLYTLYR